MASKEYKAYLISPEWRGLRAVVIAMRGYKCERCPGTKPLEVHHITYDRIYNEDTDDLEVLCKPCHDKEHGKVKKIKKKRKKLKKKKGFTINGWVSLSEKQKNKKRGRWAKHM